MSNITRVLLVFPRFTEQSFWSMAAICDVTGKTWPSPPLGLITVAALLPAHWQVKLVDCNIEPLRDEDVLAADMVMTGGMIPQRLDCLALIARVQALGRPVVVGGPDVTSSPAVFSAAEFRILGEAEGVMERFVAAWEQGERQGQFEAEKYKIDMTQSPVPRFDLLKCDRYLSIGVQFSRGCPFTCEFCDIIELFGRVPRTKTPEQVLGELEVLHASGYRGIVDFVDDNLIGNKKAVKAFLPKLVAWQTERAFPFEFFTEASINLADDDDFLALMKAANFNLVFVGIETPDTATLIAARKKQNTRRDLAESIQTINRAGIQVHAGFIVGFDQEPASIARDMIACIESAAIPVCMIGLLTALPNTQLSRRLMAEGRLNPEIDLDFAGATKNISTADQCTAGLNYRTLRPRREILANYREILDQVYRPEAFFNRVVVMASRLGGKTPMPKFDLSRLAGDLRAVGGLIRRLTLRQPEYAIPFLRTLLTVTFRNPPAYRFAISLMVYYFDLGPFSRRIIRSLDAQIAALDAEASPASEAA